MDSMQICTVLEKLERLELAMADTYESLARQFEDDEEAAGFFTRMSRDEITHRNLIRYERTIVRSDPDTFEGDVGVDIEAVDRAIAHVFRFRTSEKPPTMVQALVFAMQMEADYAENLHRSVFIDKAPNLASLIRNLAKADAKHHEELERFLERRREMFQTVASES